MQLESIIQRNDQVLFSKLNGEMLAIDSQAGYFYSMNITAGRIWELIANPLPVREICSILSKDFNVNAEQCEREVLQLLQNLLEAGLLKVNA
jgi:hypothetical protein